MSGHLKWSGLLLCPAVLQAQAIRGQAVDAGGRAVPGVVVLMLDQRDSVTARALTNERGEFRVAAGVAGEYRLRTMRIGFRPTITARVRLGAQQEVVQQVTLSGVPISLDTIRVTGRNACRVPTDSSAVVFALWEQARTALTATQLTSGGRGITATVVTYDRALAPVRDRVIRQQSRVVSGFTRQLWRSRAAEQLRTSGYVVPASDGSTIYYAPDLTVLLSEGFLEDHCFRLASSRSASEVGMAFEPTRTRRGISGIRGVLWFDRKSAELRRLEFNYTNATPEQEAGGAGGRVAFARASSGAWLISSWRIRMPVIEQRQRTVAGIATTTENFVREIRVEGGELSLLTRNRDTLWAREPLVALGRLQDSLSGNPLVSAQVSLRGTGLQGTTDAAGGFRIAGVLPGEYTLDIRTRAHDAIGARPSRSFVFADTTTVPIIRLPTPAQLAATACPVSRDGIVAGVARYAGDTTPPRGVRVVAEWDDVTATGRRFGAIEARTDATGAYRLCGLPLDALLTVRAHGDSLTAEGRELRIPVSDRFANLELVLDRRVAAGSIAGSILSDVNGQPIAGVDIGIVSLSRNTITDDKGAFRLHDVPPGEHTLTARKVGYRQADYPVSIIEGRAVTRSFLLTRVIVLDTVAVRETGLIPSFEENRRIGLGHFLTRQDIEKLNGRPLSDAFNQMRATAVVNAGNSAFVMSRRAPAQLSIASGQGSATMWCPQGNDDGTIRARCGCYPQVWLDNQLLNPRAPSEPIDLNAFDSQSIEAVEWYSGPSQTPLKYSTLNSPCGVLVIHTRRPR